MFSQVIQEMEQSGQLVSEPRSFKAYIEQQGLGNKRTADYISVQSYAGLHPELKEAGYTVLRLGAPQGNKHTHFALAKVQNDWSDFFLIDEEIFSGKPVETFVPSESAQNLLAFQLLPNLTETSLVNLALASGLLPKALGITTETQTIPSTGQSTFSFDFKPLHNSSTVLGHQNGQVEIDALFVGQRDGKECLFVVEAKSGKKLDSLAKQKLLYPVLAIKQSVPNDMLVIPVYLRTIRKGSAIEFNIAECEFRGEEALNNMMVKQVKCYLLYGF